MAEVSQELKWYVVHTYSGHENKVKASLERIVESRNMQDLITEVQVPLEDVVEIKDGVRKIKQRKIFPGYVVVCMQMNDETWYVVRNTKGVTGFVGPGSKPVALTPEELKNMGIARKEPDLDIAVGDNITIVEGPFADYAGVVTVVNNEKKAITALINMFGRETPVELDYHQIEKL